MPVGDRQKFIVCLAVKALGECAKQNWTVGWLQNRHTKDEFKQYFTAIDEIYEALGGELKSSKRLQRLHCDAYFGGEYNFILEFDEFQHFSSARIRTLEMLPAGLRLGFDKSQYLEMCNEHQQRANRYRKSKKTLDFCFSGGRTAQRAYFDAFRDILPTLHGLHPTIRIFEFEVSSICKDSPEDRRILRELIEKKVQQGSVGDT